MTNTDFHYNYTPLEKPVRITEQHWPDGTLPLVSICCTAYMHVNFIRDAVESLLMQETTFPVEILIYDDASTDGTADIVREYDAKYPQLIKSIYQTENQHSRDVRVGQIFNFSRAIGKYIAICDGDDYWVGTNKLSLQAEKMQENPDINISFHPSYTNTQDSGIGSKLISKKSNKEKIFSTKMVIIGGGEFMPTSSIFFKRSVYRSFPSWVSTVAPVGDYYIQIICSLDRGALFIPEPMSFYRIHNDSWSSGLLDKQFREKLVIRHSKALLMLDSMTEWKYSKYINYIRFKMALGFFIKIPTSFSERRIFLSELRGDSNFLVFILLYLISFLFSHRVVGRS